MGLICSSRGENRDHTIFYFSQFVGHIEHSLRMTRSNNGLISAANEYEAENSKYEIYKMLSGECGKDKCVWNKKGMQHHLTFGCGRICDREKVK